MKCFSTFVAVIVAFSTAHAAPWAAPGVHGDPFVDPGFSGITAESYWDDLSNSAHSGYPNFPGLAGWGSPILPNAVSGFTTFASLDKLASGVLGGPYPSSEGIYFGGISYLWNTYGGKLGVEEIAPVINGGGVSGDVSVISFQIQTGEAYGYDFYNNSSFPVLTYTTASGTYTAALSYDDLLDSWDNGDYEHEEGEEEPQAIIVNTYYFEWDLSTIEEEILSFEISWHSVQHSQIYGLRLDQASF